MYSIVCFHTQTFASIAESLAAEIVVTPDIIGKARVVFKKPVSRPQKSQHRRQGARPGIKPREELKSYITGALSRNEALSETPCRFQEGRYPCTVRDCEP